jgi:predicted ATPase/DNA-binding SARP family transcriptional activator
VLFGVLGTVEVRSADGDLVAVGGPRLRALLAMLLLDAGRMVGVGRLAEGLYDQDASSDPAHALQSQVSRLRRGLRAAGWPDTAVEFGPGGYRLAVDPDDVDAHRFERLVGEGRQALTTGDPTRAAGLLREALALWRGPALADVTDAPFAEAQAARLETLRVTAVEDRVEAELALGEHRRLAAELPGMVAVHPLRERLRGQLMRALYAGGRQAEALEVFEDARRTLAEELGVDPSPELGSVHLAVLRAERSLAEVPRAGVPAQLTSFVGRDDELVRVGKLLSERRLVTLIGPGGVGKTRLAVEAAGREQGEVGFVDLAPLGDGVAVPQALISALGLREAGLLPALSSPPAPADRLVAALADRGLLLVLDGCERVVDDAARLTRRLLGACPNLRILATSREPLKLTGETLCPVTPLPPPDAAALDASGHPAVRLFADRAAAVSPGFEVHAANVGAVARICAALDGLPLAIELAAARLRSLTVEQVAARLDTRWHPEGSGPVVECPPDTGRHPAGSGSAAGSAAGRAPDEPDDRFRLLSRGDRTAAPRHRTLRAVVGWSWDLLSPPEQALARRLTVFAGGATLAAAERVCGLPAGETVELLADLTDKSLVEAGGGRYGMLDTVRAFGAEQLTQTGERERLRAAHAAYFLDLAQTADPHLRRAEQLEWLARLDAERDNLHAALRWAVRADRPLALRLVAALSWHGQLRGLGERAPLAAELLEAVGPEPPAGLEEEYALCVANAAAGAAAGGTHARELRAHLARLAPAGDGRDRRPRHPSLSVLRLMVTGPAGNRDPAVGDRFRGDPWSQAFAWLDGGVRRLLSGELPEAGRAFGTALDGFRAAGDRWGTAVALDQLAELASRRGDHAGFRVLMDEAIGLAGELGAVEDLTRLLVRNADGLLAASRLDAARTGYEQATELAHRAGIPETLAGARRGLGEIARLRGDLTGARGLYELALYGCERESATAEWMRSRILTGLGRIAEAEGDPEQARSFYRQARELTRGYQAHPALAAW